MEEGGFATIQTGPDRLHALVLDARKISYNEASNLLGVSRDVIDSWAEILEHAGYVSVRRTLRDAYIVSQEYAAESKDLGSGILLHLKSFTQRTTNSIERALKEKERHLSKEQNSVMKRLKRIEDFDKQLQRKTAQVAEQCALAKAEISRLAQEREVLNTRVERVTLEEAELRKREQHVFTQERHLASVETSLSVREQRLDDREDAVTIREENAKRQERLLERRESALHTESRNVRKAAQTLLRNVE